MKQKILWICLGLSLASPSLALEKISEPTGLVNDGAGILKDLPALEERLYQLEKDTGAEMTVVTRLTLPKGESLEAYSTRLFNTWGLGKSQQNNGILFLLALKERKMRLEVGKGLKSQLPDAQAQIILDQSVRPAFKQGDYDRGLQVAITQVEKRLKPKSLQELESEVATYAEPSKSDKNLFLAVLGVGGLFVLVLLGLLLRGIRNLLSGASSQQVGGRSAVPRSTHPRTGGTDVFYDSTHLNSSTSAHTTADDDTWRSSFSSDSGASSYDSFGGGSSDGGGASSDW